MDQLIIHLFICVALPMGIGFAFMKDEAKTALLFLEIGLFVCLFSAYINGYFTELSMGTYYSATFLLTPFVEEIMKALPLIFYVVLFAPSRKQIINAAAMIGIGFAILENAYITATNIGLVSLDWALIRGLGAGLMHGICTLFVGYGLSYAKVVKKLAVTGTYACLAFAIIFHACYNLLIQSEYKFYGICLPLATIILILVIGLAKKVKLGKTNVQ